MADEAGENIVDARDAAEGAGLVYIDDPGAGITRRRNGKGWSYHGSTGAKISVKAVIERINKIGIPPAYAPRRRWCSPCCNGACPRMWPPEVCTDMALPRTLIDPKLIYLEPAVRQYPRGREVLARFPDAELVGASHWKIAQLGDPALAEDWLKMKRDTLVLGVKKSMAMRPNGRSADFIAPSSSNGCAMACAYCYVGRRKGSPTRSASSSTSTTSPGRWRDMRRGSDRAGAEHHRSHRLGLRARRER